MKKTLALLVVPLTLLLATQSVSAQNVMPASAPVRDALTLDATASTEVIPDLAIITLAAEAQGTDAAPITREVQQIINTALAQAKATAGVEARTGAFAEYSLSGLLNDLNSDAPGR